VGRVLGEDTLRRCRRVFGPNHTIALSAATGLTYALVQLGEAEPARVLGQNTLPRCRRVFGPNHPITLWAAAALTHALVLRARRWEQRGGEPPTISPGFLRRWAVLAIL
jgi:hypothetical protein